MKKILLVSLLVTPFFEINGQQFQNIFTPKKPHAWYVYPQSLGDGQDTVRVVTVEDSTMRISGRIFGYISTHESYRNFHLILDFKWGQKKYPPRLNAKRDSGILYYFASDAPDKVWPRSIECQVQETDCGDFWLVDSTSLTVNGKHYPPTKNQQVVKKSDEERPSGEWNTIQIIAKDGKCTHIVNGVIVNEGYDANVREGKIAIQSEGAEIFYRNIRVARL